MFMSNRGMAPHLFSKRNRVSLHSQCIVGKISPFVNNRAISILVWKMDWRTRSTSPQAR